MALDKVSIKVDKANIKASVMDKTASYTEFRKAMEESITGGNKNQPEIFDLNQYKETEPNNKEENDELVISNDNPNYNNTLEAYIKQIKEDLGLESFEKEMNIEITSAEELIPVLEALKKNVEDNKTETAQLESIIKQLKRYDEIDQYEKSYTEQNEYTDTYTLNDTDQFLIGNDEQVPQVEGASSIEYGVIKYQDFKNYLSEKQQKIMAYIYQTKGQKEAYEYYKKLEDQINQLKGMEKAVEEYNKIKEAGKKAGSSTTTSSFENIYGGSAYGGSSRYYSAKKTSQEYMIEYMHSIVDGTVNGLEGFLESWDNINNGNATELDYERMYLIEAFSNDKDLATGLEETYGFGESVGNMLPTVTAGTIISVSTGGAGAPVAAKLLQTAVTSSMIFGSSYGNKKHQNLLNGYKEEDAKKSAVVSALSETVLEKVLGTLPGVGNDTGNVLFNMVKEGGQEAVQQFAENLGDHFTLDSIDLENCLDDTAKSFVYGALISGTFEAGQQIVYHGTRIVVNSESLKKLKAAVNSKSEQQVQEVLKKMIEPSENQNNEVNTNKILKISDFIDINIDNEKMVSEYITIEKAIKEHIEKEIQIKTYIVDSTSSKQVSMLEFFGVKNNNDIDIIGLKERIQNANIDDNKVKELLELCNQCDELEKKIGELEKESFNIVKHFNFKIDNENKKYITKFLGKIESEDVKYIREKINNKEYYKLSQFLSNLLLMTDTEGSTALIIKSFAEQIKNGNLQSINELLSLIPTNKIARQDSIYNQNESLSKNYRRYIDGMTLVSNTEKGITTLETYIKNLKSAYKDDENFKKFISRLDGAKITDATGYKDAYHNPMEMMIYIGMEHLRNNVFSVFFHEAGHFIDASRGKYAETNIDNIITSIRKINFNELNILSRKINEKLLARKLIKYKNKLDIEFKEMIKADGIIKETESRIKDEVPDYSDYTEEKQEQIFNYIKNMIYNEKYSKFVQENALSPICDIADALTNGIMYDKYKIGGHGEEYYKNSSKRSAEIIANVSSLYNAQDIDLLDKFFPKEFKLELIKIYENLLQGINE